MHKTIQKLHSTIKPNSRNLSIASIKNWYAHLVKPKRLDPPYGHIVQIGDPILRTPAEAIPRNLVGSKEIKFLADCMRYVFKKYNCVGLSAPQIGIAMRVFMVGVDERALRAFTEEERRVRGMEAFETTVFVNPAIKIVDYGKSVFPESCESVKGFFGDVPRFNTVEITAYDENGENLKFVASGWLARIVQHEMDHLDGKLYTDLMDRSTFSCGCWEIVNERRGKVEIPFWAD